MELPREQVSADNIPDLSVDKSRTADLIEGRCAAFIALLLQDTSSTNNLAIHPSIRQLVRQKLVSRLPVTDISNGRIEISFDVEDLSASTYRRVGEFALALSEFLSPSGEVYHKLFKVPPSDWATRVDNDNRGPFLTSIPHLPESTTDREH